MGRRRAAEGVGDSAAGRRGVALILGFALTVLIAAACGGSGDSDVAQLGRDLFADNCAACHGLAGEGQDGWQQRNPDGSFRASAHDSTGHTWHHPDGLLFRIVRDGGTGIPSLGIKSGMPAFGDSLSDDQIVAVIEYLKTLWEPDGRDFQAEVTANTEDGFPP
jgi:mono/diheme cytochrome c family protein